MNITNQQYIELIGLYENYLSTLDIAIKLTGGFFIVLVIIGAIVGFRWYRFVLTTIRIELEDYFKSDKFQKKIDDYMKEQSEIFDESRTNREIVTQQGKVKKGKGI